jgi:hypothetical protein
MLAISEFFFGRTLERFHVTLKVSSLCTFRTDLGATLGMCNSMSDLKVILMFYLPTQGELEPDLFFCT